MTGHYTDNEHFKITVISQYKSAHFRNYAQNSIHRIIKNTNKFSNGLTVARLNTV